MKITYIQFNVAVSVGGRHTSITSWTPDKHADIGVEVAAAWVILTLPNKERRRIPITNVAFISEAGDEEPKKASPK